jgi:hypothetical protein
VVGLSQNSGLSSEAGKEKPMTSETIRDHLLTPQNCALPILVGV